MLSKDSGLPFLQLPQWGGGGEQSASKCIIGQAFVNWSIRDVQRIERDPMASGELGF